MTTCTPQQRAFRRFSFATAFAALLTIAIAIIPAACQTAPKPAPAAQTTSIHKQAFQVASIRPLDPHAPRENSGQGMSFPSNRFTLQRIGLKGLIQLAYGVGKISGGPAWVDSQIYSVNAKVEGDALLTQKQMQPLLQNLLEERFHLKLHRVQNIVPGYALVVAQGGPKLQPAKGGPFFGLNSLCELKYQNDSVENFVNVIGSSLKAPVVDKTGLEGTYDFDLKFVPEDSPYSNDPSCSNVPDLFIAVQKQLGLKLVAQKVPVDSFVIDHVEPLSEN